MLLERYGFKLGLCCEQPKPTKATLVPGIRVRTLPDAKCGASKADSYEMRIFTYATRT